jgi:hypothetical protein
MKHIFTIILLVLGTWMMVEQLNAGINDHSGRIGYAGITDQNDIQTSVRVFAPPEIVVPDSMKFWVMIICFIGSALSNIFGWKKPKKFPR